MLRYDESLRRAARARAGAGDRRPRPLADGDPAPAERPDPAAERRAGRPAGASRRAFTGLPAPPQRLRRVGQHVPRDRRVHERQRRDAARARQPPARARRPIREAMEATAAPALCPAGSMIVFDSTLWHAAGDQRLGRRPARRQPAVHALVHQAADRLRARARRRRRCCASGRARSSCSAGTRASSRASTSTTGRPTSGCTAAARDDRGPPAAAGAIEISVVVPTYACATCLHALHERLTATLGAMAVEYELVFVDDRAADGSWDVLAQLAARRPARARVSDVAQLRPARGDHRRPGRGAPAPGSSSWTATCRTRPRRSRACTPRRGRATTSCSRAASQRQGARVRDLAGRAVLPAAEPRRRHRDRPQLRDVQHHLAPGRRRLPAVSRPRPPLPVHPLLAGLQPGDDRLPRRAAALRQELLRRCARCCATRSTGSCSRRPSCCAGSSTPGFALASAGALLAVLLRRVAPHARLGARLDEHRDDAAAAVRASRSPPAASSGSTSARRSSRSSSARCTSSPRRPSARAIAGGRARSRGRAERRRRADPHGTARRASLDRVRRRRLLQPRARRRTGPTHRGVDWSSRDSQELRFATLLTASTGAAAPSLLDFGCGYGALAALPRRARRAAATTPATTSRRRWCRRARRIVGERADRRFTSDRARADAGRPRRRQRDLQRQARRRRRPPGSATSTRRSPTLGALARRRLAFNMLPAGLRAELAAPRPALRRPRAVVALLRARRWAPTTSPCARTTACGSSRCSSRWDGGRMTARRPVVDLRRRRLRPRRRRTTSPSTARTRSSRSPSTSSTCREPAELNGLPVVAFERLARDATRPPSTRCSSRSASAASTRARRDRRAMPGARLRARQLRQLARDALGATTPLGANTFVFESNVIQPFVTIGDDVDPLERQPHRPRRDDRRPRASSPRTR